MVSGVSSTCDRRQNHLLPCPARSRMRTLHLLTADQIKNRTGRATATTTEPPYAAIFAFPAVFAVFLFGSTFTFRFRAVDDAAEEGTSNEGPSRGWDVLICLLDREFLDVKAEAPWVAMATRRRLARNLFMSSSCG